MVGNAGTGSGTEPVNILSNTGVQIATPGCGPETTVAGAQQGTAGAKNGIQFGYSVGLLGDAAGKDNNFRGETIFNNTLYGTKAAAAAASSGLPAAANASQATVSTVPGYPTALASSSQAMSPFGLFFANANTPLCRRRRPCQRQRYRRPAETDPRQRSGSSTTTSLPRSSSGSPAAPPLTPGKMTPSRPACAT